MSWPASVLFVPSGSDRVAATRYRVSQYVPILRQKGVRCRVYPAVSDHATRLMLASPSMGRWRKYAYYLQVMAERMLRFMGLLALAPRYDVLFLQRSTFPLGLERLLAALSGTIVFDFDDSIYRLDPDDKESGWVGRLKERTKASEVEGILRVSRAAVVENAFLGEYAARHCREVATIPGPIDTDTITAKARYNDGPPVFGWIGSPSTTAYLPMVEPALRQALSGSPGSKVRLMGAGSFEFGSFEAEKVDWSLAAEVPTLQSFDVGLMPMPHNDWTNGKLGVKMLLYMAAGVPAVVSYTRTNAEVIEDGVNGFLAHAQEDWVRILARLAEDPALRRRVGEAGRRTVEERYSLRSGAPKLLALLEKLA